ncbi:MAG: PilZ domain-containing protein [bacterium]|nr:PilZ domain-containing protein [bacterium]
MERMQYIEPARRDQILIEASEKAVPIVVTTRSGINWTTHKTHLLASADFRQHLLIAAPLTSERGEVTTVTTGEQMGVSFRRGHKKCMFGAVVETTQDYPESIVVGWPEQLQELQRRVYHRSTPPRGTTIEVQCWPVDASAQTASSPDPGRVTHGTLIDVSVGGVRIRPHSGPAPVIGHTVLCQFAHKRGAPPITVDATVRHCEEDSRGGNAIGMQFVGMEATPSGRKRLVRLAKIVSEYQRSNYNASRRPQQRMTPTA